MMNFSDIKLKHMALDGQCEFCGQRCDKRVVSFIATDFGEPKMHCPDCKNGMERPYFTASEKMIDYCSRYTNWDKEHVTQYLQTIPLGITLTNFNENTREYWNWDKSKYINRIETKHDGELLHISFYSKAQSKEVTIYGDIYQVTDNFKRKINKIHITDQFNQSIPSNLKIQSKIDYYKLRGQFTDPIFVTHSMHSKAKIFTLIDGYTTYIAAKQLGLYGVDICVVKKT